MRAWMVGLAGLVLLAPVLSRTEDPGASADHVVTGLRSGWVGAALEERTITNITPGSVVGFATWNGTSYDVQSLTVDALNAGEGTRRGMWLFCNGTQNFAYSGNNNSTNTSVSLRSGYNLVAFPGPAPVAGANLTVVRNGQTVSLNSVLLPQFLEIQRDNSYVTVDVSTGGSVKPGFSYWVFASAACTLSTPGGAPVPSPSPSPAASPVGPIGSQFTTQNAQTGQTLNGAAYLANQSLYALAGDAGTIVTSPDGVAWTGRTSGTPRNLFGIAAGNNTLMAVGSQGTIVTSPDGVAWTLRNSGLPTSAYLQCAGFGNDMWVAAGGGGRIITSIDGGASWTARTSGTSQQLNGVAFGKGIFVVVGTRPEVAGNATVLTSADGVVWTARPAAPNVSTLTDVIFADSQFVATGTGGVFTSLDGVTWTTRTVPISTGDVLDAVSYAPGLFMAVGTNSTVVTSSNGVQWTKQAPPASTNAFWGVAYGVNKFVLGGALGRVLTSP